MSVPQKLFSSGSVRPSYRKGINTPSALRRWGGRFLSWWANTISFLWLFSLLLSLVCPFHEASLDASAHPWSPDARLWMEKERRPVFYQTGKVCPPGTVPSGGSGHQALSSTGHVPRLVNRKDRESPTDRRTVFQKFTSKSVSPHRNSVTNSGSFQGQPCKPM